LSIIEYGVPGTSLAAEGGDVEIVKLLIEKGADVNAKNVDGVTALMFAAGEGRLEAVKLLIEKGSGRERKTQERCHGPVGGC
jgi:uncharacterized protein